MTEHRRSVRIAAMADIHCSKTSQGAFQWLFSYIAENADILVLAGDLTDYGSLEEAKVLAREITSAGRLPVVAVLGNHDYETGEHPDCVKVLLDAGINLLDGETYETHGIGFAGVKGFAGGFGRGSLGAFGEPIMKSFVQEAVDEALKLENALRTVGSATKVVLLHYAPIADTLLGEPETIFPFLGSSRLLPPIDEMEAAVVFHGHAHTGMLEGRTPGGVPVFNVAYPVLASAGRAPLLIHALDVPESAAVLAAGEPAA